MVDRFVRRQITHQELLPPLYLLNSLRSFQKNIHHLAQFIWFPIRYLQERDVALFVPFFFDPVTLNDFFKFFLSGIAMPLWHWNIMLFFPQISEDFSSTVTNPPVVSHFLSKICSVLTVYIVLKPFYLLQFYSSSDIPISKVDSMFSSFLHKFLSCCMNSDLEVSILEINRRIAVFAT